MEPNTMNDGRAQLMAFAHTIHPQMEMAPCDLQPGGLHALPPGFEIHIDPAHDESIRLFGPGDTATRVRTLTQYGGRYLIRGIDLLRALAVLMRVGEPVWEKSLDTQAIYWRELLATAAPFTIPAPQPMNRLELEQFIDVDPACQRAISAFTESVNVSGRLVSDTDLRAFIARATDNPDAAIVYYTSLRLGRMGQASAPATPARTKRTHSVTTAQEA